MHCVHLWYWTGTREYQVLQPFLALPDYVTRADEIEICPSVCSSSVRTSVHPSVCLWHQLSLKLLHGFLSNFSCGFSWAICLDVFVQFFFFIFKNFFFDFFTNIFSLTWDPMGVEISKRYYPYKSQPKVSKLFLNFLTNGPHKSMFGIFENWNFNEFYSFSL